MKKIISMCISICLCAAVFSGCTENSPSSSEKKTEASSSAVEETTDVSSELESEAEVMSAPESKPEETSSSQSEPAPEETSDITPAMWTVSDDDGHEMTLLGSMHALTEEDYPLPNEIMDRYNSADILAVECDIKSEESAKMSFAILKDAYYDDGTTLKDHISEEGYEALSNYLSDTMYDISTLEKMKAWAVDSVLEEVGLQLSGLEYDKGVDGYLLSLAHDSGKQIYEAESIEFQMDMLLGFSDEIYDFLFRSLEDYTPQDSADELIDMHEAWRTGDVEALDDTEEEEAEELSDEDRAIYDEYNKQMLIDRNAGMEECIKELLSEGKNVFFVVGAAHYIGDDGIISLLEKDGYKVERVKYK
ncbi:MAG: TraB/GumN family protein [Ruminococcus sp.]|nr:TraB/GumN family protein [Ruminococcus sp.]